VSAGRERSIEHRAESGSEGRGIGERGPYGGRSGVKHRRLDDSIGHGDLLGGNSFAAVIEGEFAWSIRPPCRHSGSVVANAASASTPPVSTRTRVCPAL